MERICPNLNCAAPKNFIRDGYFRRKDDAKYVQRFRCRSCGSRFSLSTFSDFYFHKRRRIHTLMVQYLASNMSMKRCAWLLKVDPKTVARKLPILAERCRRKSQKELERHRGRIFNVQIDDLISKESSKMKPLSISIAVDEDRRRILAVEVSRIPAFGHLARPALKKYGWRPDEHSAGLTRVFEKIEHVVSPELVIKSDEHQRYPNFVTRYLPRAKHLTFKSERACVAGQGELKKVEFDPLFIVNHTCAMLRANVSRLVRKSWCTTKDVRRLKDHLDVFMFYYNEVLLRDSVTPLFGSS